MNEPGESHTKAGQPIRPANLIDPGQYQQAIARTNQRLRNDCQGKYFSIMSQATIIQTASGEPDQQLVSGPEIAPQFEIQHQGKPCDKLRIGDCGRLILVAGNPYTDLVLKNLIITQFIIIDDGGNPVLNGPDGWPLVAVIPPEGLCFGDLPPGTPLSPSKVSREIVLESRRGKRGDFSFDLSYTFAVDYQFQHKDHFRLSLSPS